MKNQINEIEALTNAVNAVNLNGLQLKTFWQQDKRKTKNLYFVHHPKNGSSPKLAYNEMNHFLWGMITLSKINSKI